MSRVNISNALLEEVKHTLSQMQSKEEAAIAQQSPKVQRLSPEDREIVEKAAWGQYHHLMKALPANWVQHCSTVHVVVAQQVDGHPYNYTVGVSLPSSNKLRLPPIESDFSGYRYGNNTTFEIKVDVLTDPVWTEIKAWFAQICEVRSRWNKVNKSVIEFLGNAASLNEAMKLWPQLEAYIPPKYVQKVFEKKARTATESRAAELLKSIDTDMVEASAVLARMSENM